MPVYFKCSSSMLPSRSFINADVHISLATSLSLSLYLLTHRFWTKSFFKTLIDQSVTVELKNDIKITGTLKSVDQYLNIKLDDISVHEEIKYPHLSAVKNVFIRGSVVRYVHLPSSAVDVTLLEDAARRGTSRIPWFLGEGWFHCSSLLRWYFISSCDLVFSCDSDKHA